MKNFLLYIISAAVLICAAFGLTEYLDGYYTLYLPEETDVYKVRDEKAGEDKPEFYEGESKEEIIDVLSELKIKHRKIKVNAVQGDEIDYRIYLHNGEKHYFIYLGKTNFVGDGSLGMGGNANEIVNYEEIIAKLDALLAERD